MKTVQVKQDVFLPLAAELESSLILETMDEQRTHTELKAGWKPCLRVYFSLDVLRRPTEFWKSYILDSNGTAAFGISFIFIVMVSGMIDQLVSFSQRYHHNCIRSTTNIIISLMRRQFFEVQSRWLKSFRSLQMSLVYNQKDEV